MTLSKIGFRVYTLDLRHHHYFYSYRRVRLLRRFCYLQQGGSLPRVGSLGKKGCALFLEIVHRTILLVCGPSIAENRVELLRLGRSFAQIGARDGTNENQNKCNFVLNMANTRNHHKKSHIKTKGKCQDTQATYIFMPSTVTMYLSKWRFRKLNWGKK